MVDRRARTRTTPVPSTPVASAVTVHPVVPVSARAPGVSSAPMPQPPSTDDIDAEWGAEPEPVSSAANVGSEPPVTDAIDAEWGGAGNDHSEIRDALRSPAVPKDVSSERAGARSPSSAPKPSWSRPQAPDWKPAAKTARESLPAREEAFSLEDASSGDDGPAMQPESSQHPATASPRKLAEPESVADPEPARPAARRSLGLPITLMLLLGLGGALWFGLVRPPGPAPAPAPRAAVEPAREAAPMPPAPEPRAVEPAPVATAVPSAPAASATGSVPGAALPAAASEKISVLVKLRPTDAKVYLKGKEVGTSGMTVELAPGERRSFEVGKPGYVTRKLTVDGTKAELFIGLRPESSGEAASE